jgi:hypothetical protein
MLVLLLLLLLAPVVVVVIILPMSEMVVKISRHRSGILVDSEETSTA